MKKCYFTLEKDMVLKILREEVKDTSQAEKICGILEELSLREKDEKRSKQLEGIKKAKESGVSLGRPRLREPDNFGELVTEWENGNIRAEMAARACKMGVSTFYRRVRNYRNELNKSEGKAGC